VTALNELRERRLIRLGFPFPPAGSDGTTVWDCEAAIEVMHPRLPPQTARELLGIDAIELPGGHFAMAEDPGPSPTCWTARRVLRQTGIRGNPR
jgi:hypothetical protein